MPMIELSRLKLESPNIVIRPLRADSDFVRTEKKYDRHGFGEVLAVSENTGWRTAPINVGDLVIYDDTHSIEFPVVVEKDALPEIVECVHASEVYGLQKASK